MNDVRREKKVRLFTGKLVSTELPAATNDYVLIFQGHNETKKVCNVWKKNPRPLNYPLLYSCRQDLSDIHELFTLTRPYLVTIEFGKGGSEEYRAVAEVYNVYMKMAQCSI